MKTDFNFFINDDFDRPLWLIHVDKIDRNLEEAEFSVSVYAGGEMPKADYIDITESISYTQWGYFNEKVLAHFREHYPSDYTELEFQKALERDEYKADKLYEYYKDRELEQMGIY